MSSIPPPSVAPGWYPDPSGAPMTRYFDGQQWTTSTAPTPVGGERRFTIHYGFALLAFFALLGTVIPCLFWFGVDAQVAHDSPDSAGLGSVFGVLWGLWGGMWTIVWTAFAVQHTLKSRR